MEIFWVHVMAIKMKKICLLTLLPLQPVLDGNPVQNLSF